jgi:hypothetical protein
MTQDQSPTGPANDNQHAAAARSAATGGSAGASGSAGAGSGGSAAAGSGGGSHALLGVYLNDHLAGSTSGLGLARRTARAHRGTPSGAPLQRIAAEIAEDRAALLDIMRTLNVPVRRYKIAGGWVIERVGRLKPNARLFRRSPLSSLIELEALRLGIEGKSAGWRALRGLATHPGRIDADRLDRLITRADEQAATVEELRLRAAADAFPR